MNRVVKICFSNRFEYFYHLYIYLHICLRCLCYDFFIRAFEPRKWTIITENRNQINMANERALLFAFRPNIHVHNCARMSKCITMQQKPAVLRYYQPNRYHLYGIYVHEISAFVRANKLYVQKR